MHGTSGRVNLKNVTLYGYGTGNGIMLASYPDVTRYMCSKSDMATENPQWANPMVCLRIFQSAARALVKAIYVPVYVRTSDFYGCIIAAAVRGVVPKRVCL